MGGIDEVKRRQAPVDEYPGGTVERSSAARATANAANNPWLDSFTDRIAIPYPAPFLHGTVPTSGAAIPSTLGGVADEILRLRETRLAPDDSAARASIAKRICDLQSAWVEKARAAGMKEPSASFSPWTATSAELGDAFLFTHLAGIVPLDAARVDGGLHFKEDIFEALALRKRGLDDEVIDSYASDPGTQRLILERELRRLGETTQCKPDESIEDLRLRRAKLVTAPIHREEDRTLYIGLDGKIGTFQALVDYELEERILAGNPGTVTGSTAATFARYRSTDEMRAAGQLGNAVGGLGGAIAGKDLRKLGEVPPKRSGRRRPRPEGPGLGRRTRSAGGMMPRRNDRRLAAAETTAATATETARSRTPAGLNDKHLGGEIRGGRAVGFHHEASANGRSRLVPGSETKPDAHGVYEARVEIRNDAGDWVAKGTPSSFFPKQWTRSEVRTAILQAYANRHDDGNGNWSGTVADGMRINGHSDQAGVIDSAYPLVERK